MKAKDLMSQEPFLCVVSAESTILEALNIMDRAEIRHLPVLSAEREVLGMISDRDIRSHEMPFDETVKDPISATQHLEQPVRSLLDRELIAVNPESSLSEIIEVMLAEKVGALAVVDPESNTLEGVVSYIDILGGFQSIIEKIVD